MSVRLFKALRDAIIIGMALVAAMLVIDYVRADSPEWGAYSIYAVAFAAAYFVLRLWRIYRRHNQQRTD